MSAWAMPDPQFGDGVYYNVKFFGAVGDGVADDAPAVQAALNAMLSSSLDLCHANGGTLFFPRGVFRLASAIAIQPAAKQSPRITMTGCGSSTQLLIDANGSTDIFSMGPLGGLVVRDCVFVGVPDTNSDHECKRLFNLLGVETAAFDKCDFEYVSCTEKLISVGNGGVFFRSCRFDGAGGVNVPTIYGYEIKSMVLDGCQFIDYANFNGYTCGKVTGVAIAWVKVENTETTTVGAYVTVRNTHFDESAIRAVWAKKVSVHIIDSTAFKNRMGDSGVFGRFEQCETVKIDCAKSVCFGPVDGNNTVFEFFDCKEAVINDYKNWLGLVPFKGDVTADETTNLTLNRSDFDRIISNPDRTRVDSFVPLNEITITDPIELTIGSTLQLEAEGLYSDGTSRDLTEKVRWVSSDDVIASVSETGLLTLHTAGDVTIRAEQGLSSLNVGVNAAPVFDHTLWPEEDSPASTGSGGTGFELGTKFTVDEAGYITKLRFYKLAGESGVHTGYLWSGTGTALASVEFEDETASGWQEQELETPIAAAPGTTYTVSRNVNGSLFPFNSGYFNSAMNAPPLHAPVGAGVYAGSHAFPTSVYSNSNYWIDVVFSGP